ncbi:arylsulfotransferase family protein [Ruegeria atlantica]|uniref:arylsulfotransferase family protein n=1 Tax=Ruegeria atlantica TaxID=81569 RepID=UPI00147FE8D0|nr:arylsulfotransferase family protein [Ruegeria atlantica]
MLGVECRVTEFEEQTMKPAFEKLPERLFRVCLVFSVICVSVLYGMFAQKKNWPPAPQFRTAYNVLFVYEALSRKARAYRQHLQPSRGQGDGVMVNEHPDRQDTILLMGYFEGENQARLVKRDGSVIRKWTLDYFQHYPDVQDRPCAHLTAPLLTDVHGALLTPKGELVFNYEYCGTVKLDQCSNLLWRLDEKTHHSMVASETGGYLTLGRNVWNAAEVVDRFPPFSTPATNDLIWEDVVLRLDDNGQVLERVSIPGMIMDSGLTALLTANNEEITSAKVVRNELLHSNKIDELPSELAEQFPIFNAGDWVISMRGLNLVIVVDPASRVVKWHQTGPWIRQHDPEFRPDGKISIFNNNAYLTSYDKHKKTRLAAPRDTNIVIIDPVTRETEVVFGNKPGQEMLSVIRGQHEVLEDGGLLITEFDAGRVLEVDGAGNVTWEYINKYDAEFVGEITNAKLYPLSYFETDWKECMQ